VRSTILFLLLALLFLPALAVAQEPETSGGVEAPAGEDEAGDESAAAPPEEDGPSLDAIERMLLEDEAVLEGSGYTYNSGDRRDPFRSLLRVVEEPDILGVRPDGVPGLLIDEIEVTGVFVTGDGPVAQVQSSSKDKSYLVHIGDAFYDGEIAEIRFERSSTAEVVFRQDVRDPTATKPFREVVKQLNPDD